MSATVLFFCLISNDPRYCVNRVCLLVQSVFLRFYRILGDNYRRPVSQRTLRFARLYI